MEVVLGPASPTRYALQFSHLTGKWWARARRRQRGSRGRSGCQPAGEEGRDPAPPASLCPAVPPLHPKKSVSSDHNQELLHRFLGLPTEEMFIGLLEGDVLFPGCRYP